MASKKKQMSASKKSGKNDKNDLSINNVVNDNDNDYDGPKVSVLPLWTPNDLGPLMSDISIAHMNDDNHLNHQTAQKSPLTPSKSKLPIYTGNGMMRQRRHSDGPQQQNVKTKVKCQNDHNYDHHNARHNSGSSSPLAFLHQCSQSSFYLPDTIKAQHAMHRCALSPVSRSVPTSEQISSLTTPVQSPSSNYAEKGKDMTSAVSVPSRKGSAASSNAFPVSSSVKHFGKSNSKNLSPRVPNRQKFDEYMPLCELQKGLQRGEIVEGVLRINPRNYQDAYISAPDGGVDIYIGGMHNRNRSLNGDRVAVKISDPSAWKLLTDGITRQRTGCVVLIMEMIHPRIAGGQIKPMKDRSVNWALFVPRDSRIPRMMIPMDQCPKGFIQHPEHFTHALFVAKLDDWKCDATYPRGSLLQFLGNEGNIEAESEIILLEHGVDYNEFPRDAFIGLPNIEDKEWTIPDEELLTREDLRNNCIFTIDPTTARDLDDALSIKQIDADTYIIGVHIADVSYFVREGIPLDDIARHRSTSVYLVHKVIPMLPPLLCEKLCSLNPGEDKLTFSVIWKINSNGEILDEWFGRTVINSCMKLSYELAQNMIDEPNREWKSDEMPKIYGNWSYADISKSVCELNEIGMKLRKKRFDNGALRIEKLKLHFILDKDTGLPSGFSPYIYRDTNKLVEEFMLLANMAVAHRIYNSYGQIGKAFLRSHPKPDEKLFKDFKQFCDSNNFEINTQTSLSLQHSLNTIVNDNPAISKVVAHYLLKSMNQALYFCNGMNDSVASYHHYALNVPLYTHFTSPIRRYPDIIVHRLLAASLKYRNIISESILNLHRLASKCNERKMNARLISDSSAKLFLHFYIKHIGIMEDKAVVIGVYDHSFDVMLLKCGSTCRVYLNNLPVTFVFETHSGRAQLVLVWKLENSDSKNQSVVQIITSCIELNVQVSVNGEDSSKLNVIIQHPNGFWPEMPQNKTK